MNLRLKESHLWIAKYEFSFVGFSLLFLSVEMGSDSSVNCSCLTMESLVILYPIMSSGMDWSFENLN